MYYFLLDVTSNTCIEVFEDKQVAVQEANNLNAIGFPCYVQDTVGVA